MEPLVIKKDECIRSPLCDDSLNWEVDPEEDPTAHFEFRTETKEP